MWQILYYQGSWPWRTHRVSHIPTMATQHSCHLYSLAIDAQICPLQEWDETWMMSYDWFRPIMTFPFPCFQVFFGSLPIQSRASQWALRENICFSKIWLSQVLSPFIHFQPCTEVRRWRSYDVGMRAGDIWLKLNSHEHMASVITSMSDLFHCSSIDCYPNLTPEEAYILKSMHAFIFFQTLLKWRY